MAIGVGFPDSTNKKLRCPIKLIFQKISFFFILCPKYCNIIKFSYTLFIVDPRFKFNGVSSVLFGKPSLKKEKEGFWSDVGGASFGNLM